MTANNPKDELDELAALYEIYRGKDKLKFFEIID